MKKLFIFFLNLCGPPRRPPWTPKGSMDPWLGTTDLDDSDTPSLSGPQRRADIDNSSTREDHP